MESDDGIDIVAGKVQIVAEGDPRGRLARSLRHRFRLWSVQSLLVRRNVFDRVGTFDTRFKTGMDIDWYARAREAAIRYALVPEYR